MFVLVYHIGSTTDILLCGQLVGGIKDFKHSGFWLFKILYIIISVCCCTFHVNFDSLVRYTETEY